MSKSKSSEPRRWAFRLRPGRIGADILGLGACLLWAFPVYWVLNTSLKLPADIMRLTPQFVPSPPSLTNFIGALSMPGFVRSLRNSLFVALIAVAVTVVVAFLATAALTKFRFRARRGVLVSILVIQMVPATAVVIPLFLSFRDLGLLNNYLGLVIAYVAMVLPFSVWVLRGFFLMIPDEIEDAAQVDGASAGRILWSIYLPLVAPGLIATSVFAFIHAWNDYIIAYVMMRNQANYTLPIWLVSFSTDVGTDFGGMIAASVLFAVPVVVFFMIIQRNLVAGMAGGAVKG
jgi:N,N'-diacetylchitobiose transport system permease protein